ncbi:MAG: hypothetical protein OK452_11450 [Thaumarchaeota archaeon]|nr:hypothetical protein [Nitrososphaerota archaeon]
MSEVLWWPEESWWERRSLPLLGFNLAPRQLFMLSFTGLLGFVLSSSAFTFLGVSPFVRVGVFLFFLSIGFVFATKRVKMAPVELQLYYRFVRKQGILRSVAEPQRIIPPKTIPETKPSTRPLLLGTVAGCLLATFSLSVLASSIPLKVTGEGLLVFVAAAGALSLVIDRKLRRVGQDQKANSADELFSGMVLSAVLYFIALHSSPLILIPEVACGFLIVRGVLDIGRSSTPNKSTGPPRQ